MKRLRLITIFLCGCIYSYAANSPGDSLKTLISTAKEDTAKVNLLLALSKSYYGSSPDEAIKYAIEAKDLAEKIHYDKGEAIALKNAGIANYIQSKYIETLDYWN